MFIEPGPSSARSGAPGPAPSPHLPLPPRRMEADRLRKALDQLAGGRARIASHHEHAWASITFTGTRHRIELLFDGAAAVEAGELFIDALPEHEFIIPGRIVAEAVVTEVDHLLLPEPRLAVAIELLVLEDA